MEEVLKRLASSKGYDIVANSLDDDYTEFYLFNISTRTVNITKEDNGYQVRITVMASKEDFVLFKETVMVVAALSSGTAYLEDDDDERIDDVDGYFSEGWIQEQMADEFTIIRTLLYDAIKKDKKKGRIDIAGPLCPFCIGINLFKMLGIDEKTDARLAHDLIIRQIRYSQYSRPEDIRRTSTRMVVKGKNEGDKDRHLTFYFKNEYDMISYAELIALINGKNDTVILEYDDFMKIAPKKWERFDDRQYFTTDLTDEEWQELYNEAKRYSI